MKFEYPKNVHFKCLRCALCCGDTETRTRTILLMSLEANYISRKTSKNVEEFAEKIEQFEPYVYVMKKTEKGKCVFLNGDFCTVYSIRPLICRFYPFTFKSKGNNRFAFTYTDECPGIGKGSKLERKFFQNLYTKLRKQMNKNLTSAQK